MTTKALHMPAAIHIRGSDRPRVGACLAELWGRREVLYFLAWRDLTVRYRQTVFGVAWAVLQPTLMMVVFTVFFGRLAQVPSDGVPYPLFAFAGLLPWQLFSQSITASASSLVANERLVTKLYFPRLAIPVAPILTALVDFVLAFVLLLLAMAHYRIAPTWGILAVPFLVALTLAAALAAGVGLAALNVEFRDVRHALPFLVQLWMFATPIAYPASLVPSRWRLLYGLNPLSGVVEGFRWALVGGTPPGPMLVVSTATVAVVAWASLAYFVRVERGLADRI